jgi:ribosomal-protein-alanine N-acetyltransferase
MNPPQRIETDRLLLRKPNSGDVDAVFDYASDPVVTRFLTFGPYADVSEVVFIERCDQLWADASAFPWAITVRGSDELLGTIEARPTDHGVELGYVLRRSAWGNGYMTEAVEAVSEWFFGRAGVHRVWAYVDTANTASQRVLERAGMVKEGTLHRWAAHPNVSSEPSDAFMYARWR